MITRFRISNFKRLDEVELDLGSSVVLIGANHPGRSQAVSMQFGAGTDYNGHADTLRKETWLGLQPFPIG